jgi:GWxTD domain-containing protein
MPASIFISGRARVIQALFPAALLITLLGACSAARARIAQDPYYESFYEKARLIMTEEENQIYRHLAENADREAFIEEFWKKRDPYPETPENEIKEEFERRINYANRWFKENRAAGRGWDTQRGRILLQLGEPDNRYLVDNTNNPNIKGYERWIYYYYQLELIFIDSSGFGEFRLRNWPAELLTAIEQAKFTLNATDRKAMKNAFAFEAAYNEGQIVITIPLKRIRFRDEGENARADFKVTVYVYRDYRKIDTPTFTHQFSYPKDDIPGDKEVSFSLPYPLEGEGKYFFDVIVEDASTASRSRNIINFKR